MLGPNRYHTRLKIRKQVKEMRHRYKVMTPRYKTMRLLSKYKAMRSVFGYVVVSDWVTLLIWYQKDLGK